MKDYPISNTNYDASVFDMSYQHSKERLNRESTQRKVFKFNGSLKSSQSSKVI